MTSKRRDFLAMSGVGSSSLFLAALVGPTDGCEPEPDREPGVTTSSLLSLEDIAIVDSVAEAQALAASSSPRVIVMTGYHEPNDGGGGVLVVDEGDSVTPVDDGTVFAFGSGRMQRQFSGPLNVRWFGARGDGSGPAAEAQAINRALAGGEKHVFFPAGSYRVSSYLRVYAKTRIELHPAAIILNDNSSAENLFVNGELGNTTYASGYCGEGDIHISGGTMDGAPRMARNQLTTSISIAHAQNVVIEGVRFVNNRSSHFVEINSSKDVVIRDCVFENLDPSPDSPGSRECINIDHASMGGFPHFGGYDGTVCENVTIERCRFRAGDVGIGSHSAPLPGTCHRNIRILDCAFEGMISAGIAPQFWRDSEIAGNRLYDCGARGIRAWGLETSAIVRNVIQTGTMATDCSSPGPGGPTPGVVGIAVDNAAGRPSFGVQVRWNRISSMTQFGIWVQDSSQVDVQNNSIELSGSNAIRISTGTGACTVLDNVIRGANESGIGASAIFSEGDSIRIHGNSIEHAGVAYAHAIQVTGAGASIRSAGAVAGSSGLVVSDGGALTEIDGMTLLFSGSVSAGSVTLAEDIRRFGAILVATGVVATGNYSVEIARGYGTGGFRPGTDFVNVRTSNGKIVMAITNPTTLTIQVASDPLRQIYGLAGPPLAY